MVEGWHWLENSSKWHYFGDDGRSLCGRWATFDKKPENFEQGADSSSDNCVACAKKLLARRTALINERSAPAKKL
jgi:hypothetical protein